jgi:hypothetical protein
MLVALAAGWVPTVVGLALAGGLSGILLIWVFSDPGGPDTDEPDSDSDGGSGRRRPRRPRRPPPVGPVSWPDFERQFAAYVERRARTGERDRTRTRARAADERTPSAAGNPRRGG